jgi:hypothetical protein
MRVERSRLRKRLPLVILVVIVSGSAALLAFSNADFNVYYDAALALRAGRNPYTDVPHFNSPVSVLLYFIPVSFLPAMFAFRLTVFLSVMTYCVVIFRLSGRRLGNTCVALLSSLFLYNAFYNNVDWLAMLGSIVRPELGFWLAMTKPQIGIVVAAQAALAIGAKFSWWVTLLFILAQAGIYAISFGMGMAWSEMMGRWGNFSLFPLSLIVGIPLAVAALTKRKPGYGLAAGPLLSPYVGPQSWIATLPALAERWWLIVPATVISWILAMMLLR